MKETAGPRQEVAHTAGRQEGLEGGHPRPPPGKCAHSWQLADADERKLLSTFVTSNHAHALPTQTTYFKSESPALGLAGSI